MEIRFRDCFRVGVSIFLLYLAIHYWDRAAVLMKSLFSAAMPLIIGGVIAYLVNILMAAYERQYFVESKNDLLIKSRRPVCMLFAFLTLIAIVALVFGLIIPQLGECISLIIQELPGFMEKVIDIADKLHLFSAETLQSLEGIDWKSQIGNLMSFVTSGLGDVMGVVIDAVSTVFSAVVTALLSIIFAIYLLAGKETLGKQFGRILKRYGSEKIYNSVTYFVTILDECFHRYIVGQCIEALIIGVLCTVGMSLLRLPYALMVGALVAFTALIPVAGAYIGAAVGAFMILTVDPFQAVVFLVFLVILQQVEGNLIYPKVVGSSMGLPGIWVLAAVTIGGGIMGVGGMLLGVPLAATAYRIIRDDVRSFEAAELPAEPEKTDDAENDPAS